MYKILFTLLLSFVACGFTLAQTPGGINYQGVARSQFLTTLNNDSIQIRFTIKEKNVDGPILYTETRGTRTDSFGVFSVVIGAPNAIIQSDNIKKVPWSDTTKKFLMVELNILDPNTPGFLNMGTTELLSVPFSFYSDISDSAKFSNGSGRYYFSATMPPKHRQLLPNGDYETFNIPIKFPSAIFNEGNHYDTLTSEFTAPDSGIYAFEVTFNNYWMIGGDNKPFLQLAIVKNSKVVKLLAQITGDYDWSYSNANGQTRMKLKKGDKVGIRAANTSSDFVTIIGLDFYDDEEYEYLIANYEMSSFAEFSGYKVK